MLSNKTYFLEEITKQKKEKKGLKRELTVLKEKGRLADENLAKKEARIDELLTANELLRENVNKGSKEKD